ncbi:MAG: FliH/SctL family protein [Rhodospirillaceae bacterium]|nr:FliH/SctL family protein [Rhodospirillaceae bacterium]
MPAARPANKRFLFERSFDDPRKLYLPGEKRKSELEAERKAQELAAARAAEMAAKAPPVEAAPQAPAPKEPEAIYTQAQLDAAREEGYVAGHTAALEEAETAREHYVADAISLIAQGLSKLDEQQQATNRDIGELAIRVLFAVARKTIPETAHQFARENVTDFVKKVLPVVLGEPKLLIRVHAMIVEDVQGRLAEVFTRAGFQGGYMVVADYELQPGDCKLEWSGGGAERSEARIWAEIERTMAENFGELDDSARDDGAATTSDEQRTQEETTA